MGERAYIIKREGDEWTAVYSHWGSAALHRGIDELIQRYCENAKKLLTNGGYEEINVFEELKKVIEEIRTYEITEKNEEIHRIKEPSKFIDWTDIIIESWIIIDEGFISIYEPVILMGANCGVLLMIEKPAIGKLENREIIRALQKFKEAKHAADFIGYMLKYRASTPEMLKEIFQKYVSYGEMDHKLKWMIKLVIGEPEGYIKDIINRDMKLLIA